MPVLRADFQLADYYTPLSGAKLSCGVIALGGREDTDITESSLLAWREATTSTFAMKTFPGGHLFLNSQRAALVDYVVRQMYQRMK
jgi:medium-chain acyl-[acyl-carrier-protein] hydrolase